MPFNFTITLLSSTHTSMLNGELFKSMKYGRNSRIEQSCLFVHMYIHDKYITQHPHELANIIRSIYYRLPMLFGYFTCIGVWLWRL